MNILILDEELPYPQDSGKRIRVHALLTRMAKRHELTLCCYARPDVEDFAIRQLSDSGIRVAAVAPVRRVQSGGLFYSKLLANLFSSLPYVSWNYCSLRMRRQLHHLVSRDRFDLIHSEMTLLTPLLKGITTAPTFAVAHNVETEIWRRYENTEASPIRRLYIGLQRRRVERLESFGLSHLTALCTVTDRDSAWFKERSTIRRSHVVPNGVDLTYFRPSTEPEEPEVIVHAGSMDWRPNVDAMSYFLEEIYPRIYNERPRVQLFIVGRNPSEAFVRLASRYPGVRVTGSVEDVRPFMASGAVFVVPLRVGGGSRLKILNALAMGKAVVSTSVGAEGLETRNDEHLLLADSSDAFADRVLELLRDPVRRKQLGMAGRALVKARYGWDAIAERLDVAWCETVAGFRDS